MIAERDAVLDRAGDSAASGTGQLERVDNLERGLERVDEQIAALNEEARDAMRAAVASGSLRLERGSDGTDDTPRHLGGEYDRGRRNIDAAARAGHLPDHVAAKATALLEQGPSSERSLAARWADAASDALYPRAGLRRLRDDQGP